MVATLSFVLTLLLPFSLFYSSACSANPSTVEIAAENSNVIKIARGSGDYPPLEMVREGVLTGLHIDMILYVAEKLDIEIEFVSLPWGRATKYFSEGKVDAISYYGFTKEREGFAYYHTDNILSETHWVLIALEDRKGEFAFDRSLQGLDNYIVGVQLAYSHGIHFDGMSHFQRDVVKDEFEIETMLNSRRHDLAMMSYQEFLGFKERGDFKGIVALSPSIDSDPQYLAFAKRLDENNQRAELTERFAKEFKKFKISKKYEDLLQSYNFKQYQY